MMNIESNKKMIKIIETTKGQISSPFSNPNQQIKLILFNETFRFEPSKIKSNNAIDLQHLNYHKTHCFTLENSSVPWVSIEHQIRQLLSFTNLNEEDLLIFESSSYNEKIPQIFNHFKIVKGFNYRIKLDSLLNISQDNKALMTEEHTMKQIEMEFSLGNGVFRPGYIGEILFEEIQNPLFAGIIKAYLNFSSKTQCPIIINFASEGEETYQIVFEKDSLQLIEKFNKKISILCEFLLQCHKKNCSKNIILFNLPIILIQSTSITTAWNYFQNKIEEIITTYNVTLGFKLLRYSLFNEKQGINEIIKLINKFPDNIILSAGIKYKTDLIANSGQGLSIYYKDSNQHKNILHMNSIEYMRHFDQRQFLQKVLKSNILRLFDWKEKKQEIKVELFWKCDYCQNDFSQKIKAFSKFGRQFCSIKCLKGYKF